MNQEIQILIFLILFLVFIIVVHKMYIQPSQKESVHAKEEAKKWVQMQREMNQQDIALKSSQSIHNTDIDLGNTLPSDHEIRIEDSFTEQGDDISKTEYENLVESSVPTLNTQQCWYSKEFECPPKNGNYLQCTNNYIPKPNQKNCDCSNRTFEMCPYPYKISENEYYKKIGFDRKKEFVMPSFMNGILD